MVSLAKMSPRPAHDLLREWVRSQRSGEEPFFDGAPGCADLSAGATPAAADWL
jgi:hypothetical protein